MQSLSNFEGQRIWGEQLPTHPADDNKVSNDHERLLDNVPTAFASRLEEILSLLLLMICFILPLIFLLLCLFICLMFLSICIHVITHTIIETVLLFLRILLLVHIIIPFSLFLCFQFVMYILPLHLLLTIWTLVGWVRR